MSARVLKGVRVMRLTEDSKVVTLARAPHEEEDEEEDDDEVTGAQTTEADEEDEE